MTARERIVQRLLEYCTPELWLASPHPQLEDAVPNRLIAEGEAGVVEEVLDRLDGDVYL